MRQVWIGAGAGLVLLCGATSSQAEKPVIDGVLPAGGRVGSEFGVEVTGKLEPWPLQAVCDEPGIVFTPDKKGQYQVKILEGVEEGAYLVRFFNKEGAAAPRLFMVGTAAERSQKGTEVLTIETNELPLTVNGRLDSAGDVDRFAFELEKGEVVVAEVCAYAIDSPIDPLLHMRGSRGEQLAFNHDRTRVGLDPGLVFRAPAKATYELHLSGFGYPPKADIRFAGGASYVYRLALSSDPPVIPFPEPHESESDDPQSLVLPASVSGRIGSDGDVDRYKLSVKKGQIVRFEVLAATLGSWMDPVLVIRNGEGKELKRLDDLDAKDNPDVQLDWTVPADGDYLVEILDLNGKGGADLIYQFKASQPEPSIAVKAVGGVYSIKAGDKVEIAVTVTRRYGFKGALEVGIDGLPPGVTAPTVEVGEKGAAKLTLQATAEVLPANLPLTIWAAPKGEADPAKRVAGRFEVKGSKTDLGDLLINDTDRGWLTVLKMKK